MNSKYNFLKKQDTIVYDYEKEIDIVENVLSKINKITNDHLNELSFMPDSAHIEAMIQVQQNDFTPVPTVRTINISNFEMNPGLISQLPRFIINQITPDETVNQRNSNYIEHDLPINERTLEEKILYLNLGRRNFNTTTSLEVLLSHYEKILIIGHSSDRFRRFFDIIPSERYDFLPFITTNNIRPLNNLRTLPQAILVDNILTFSNQPYLNTVISTISRLYENMSSCILKSNFITILT